LFDIIVVGGGPVGSEVAFKTASAGYSVAVTEQRKDYSSRVCCTGIVSLECMSSFAIDDSLVKRKFSSATFFSPSGNKLSFERKEPIACVLNRAAFDTFMAGRAIKTGVNYLFGAQVESLAFAPDRVQIQLKQGSEFSILEARVAVIAAGATSPIVRRFYEHHAMDSVMGAQAEVEAPGIEEIEIYCGKDIAPDFFAWLVPVAGGRALAGLLTRKGTGNYMKKFLARLHGDGKIKTDVVDINYRTIALRPPKRTYGDRLIIVGGAAGQLKPTTGGGIYFGLLSAHIAAAVLNKALRSDGLSASCLASYEVGWKDKLMPELNSGYLARTLYEHLSDGEINALFSLAKTLDIEKRFSSMDDLSFDWHTGVISKLTQKYYNI
jgi:geranylgeranyl reductase family protein